MRYHLTLKSQNPKTGPIPVSTTGMQSCPPSCPLFGRCYASGSALNFHWRKLTLGERGDSWPVFLSKVRAIPAGQLWRHDQAGDLPGVGERINSRQLLQLARAAEHTRGFTYTHKPPTKANLAAIRGALSVGFTINLSANNPTHADRLSRHRLPVVTIVPTNHPEISYTPQGRKIIICPAQSRSNVTCSTCKLCSRADRSVIIGFRAHGAFKKEANAIASHP